MGAGGRSAEVWAGWRTVAEKVAAAIGALVLLGLALGGPAGLSIAAAGLAAVGGIVVLGLLVVERRARRRELGARSGTGGLVASAASGGAIVAAGGLDEVPDDAHVVFVSYAREDDVWRRRFATMLTPLGERGVVVWSDERIGVGVAWRPELERAIARADAALVLVSPDLLASEFIMGEELPALRARGIPLSFVHVRASMVDEFDALLDVQWAHDRGRPLAGANDPDGETVRICRRLAGLLPVRGPRAAGAPTVAARGHPPRRSPRLAGGARLGALDGVPPPATGEVERDELAGLRDALLGAGEGVVGITGRSRGLGLHGQGGIGKTVLAGALARDEQVRRHFPDGVFWVTVGERGDVVALQLALLERLGAARPELRSRDAAQGALRAALAGRRCLLVVDDVWTPAAAAAFDVSDELGRVLYSTRDERVLAAVDAAVRRVDVLPERAARTLLAGLTARRVEALPAAVDRVLEATGRVALALALVGAAVGRGGRDWDEVAGELEDASTTFLDHPYADVFKAMQVGVGALDDRLAGAYRTLAVYPQDERVPVAAIARLWAKITAADSDEQARAMLGRLAARELLVLEDDAISFHDLQHEFLLLRAGDMRLAHDEVLGAYRALLPDEDPSWHRLPPSEPYIWEHLLGHLRGAGDMGGVHAVATDLAYLAVRCARDGPYAVESDLRTAARLHPGDAAIDWAIDTFTRWGHLFAGHATAGDLAATLAIRAQHPPPPLDVGALRALTSAPLLTARWGLPNAPDTLLRTLEGHTDWVTAVAFSPDGTQLASASDGTVRLWDPASGQASATLEGHTSGVTAVAFSPDGTQLASAGDDKTVRLWDPATGQATATLEGHTGWVRAVAFSPDGTRLASAGGGRTVRLWNPASGQATATLEGHTGAVTAVAFSPDGTRLASAGDDKTVRLWNPASGQPSATLEGHTGGVTAVAFSPDGTRLASAGNDRTVRLWDPASGQATATLEGHIGGVTAVAFSPDGTRLASADNHRKVRLWDPASGQATATLEGHTGGVNAVAFSPDGTRLASAGDDGTVRLWDRGRGSWGRPAWGLLRRRRRPSGRLNDRGMVTSVAFSSDGCTLASASDDTIALWDIDRRTPLIRARTGTQIADLAWNADRIALATATAVACLDFVDSGEDSTTSAITARRMATFR